MFDTLVESARQKHGGRARRLFFVTGAVYAVALSALGVMAIVGFNSALAEEYDITIGLVPPPPPPTPAVKPTPTPTPAQVVRLTSVLTQGRVLRRVQPPYPAIAKQARVQGQVQVQIGISETGDVTDVILLSGHPLLRDAAL